MYINILFSYGSDGDLDLAVSGNNDAKLYTNNVSSVTVNDAPSAPDVFTSAFKDGLLNLSWGNGTDDLTSDFTAMTNRAGFFRVDAEVNFE